MRMTAALFALLLPACLIGSGEISGVDDGTGGGDQGGGGGGGGGDNGGGDDTGGGTQPTPKVAATVDRATVSTQLGKTENLVITITGSDGFAGPVTVTPSIAATGWTLTPTPASVDLAMNGTATVTLAVTIPTNTAALTPMLSIDLASSAAPASVTSAFMVANQVTVDIGSGTGTGAPHTGLPSPSSPIRILLGAKVIFHNGDTIQHVIHADGGISHQNTGQGLPGTDYITTPTDNATWYCHNHESGGTARPILVQ